MNFALATESSASKCKKPAIRPVTSRAMTSRFEVASRANVPPFHVMDLLAAAKQRSRTHGDLINFVAGQPMTGAPAPVTAEAIRLLQSDDPLGYTEADGIPELRETPPFARWHVLHSAAGGCRRNFSQPAGASAPTWKRTFCSEPALTSTSSCEPWPGVTVAVRTPFAGFSAGRGFPSSFSSALPAALAMIESGPASITELSAGRSIRGPSGACAAPRAANRKSAKRCRPGIRTRSRGSQ